MCFKKGDIVKCINKNGNLDSDLIIGKKYTVTENFSDFSGNWIGLKGLSSFWSDYQFVLSKREIKPFGIVKFMEKTNVNKRR